MLFSESGFGGILRGSVKERRDTLLGHLVGRAQTEVFLMNKAEFLRELRELLRVPVEGISLTQKRQLVEHLAQHLCEGQEALPTCEFLPFVTGRRPFDEVVYAGYGSSQHAGLILPDDEAEKSRLYLLYRLPFLAELSPEERERFNLVLSLSLAVSSGDPKKKEMLIPLPQWTDRALLPQVFEKKEQIELAPVSFSQAAEGTCVFSLSPNLDLLSSSEGASASSGTSGGLAWESLAPALQAQATDDKDLFTFGHLFHQTFCAQLSLKEGDLTISQDEIFFDVYDARRFNSLYRRILQKIVEPDTEAQAKAQGLPSLESSFHPWFPVLSIGSEKADLYMRAIYLDIIQQKHFLTDPRWLIRVGMYLELLTCLGIFEAVKDDLGDLLSPAERAIFSESSLFAPIRKYIDVPAWRKIWAMRKISFAGAAPLSAGPVSFLNLLNKKKVTLAFLEAHHNDLKWAIYLAGPNIHNAQETWHRVFRDAERAVLKKNSDAFPELSYLGDKVRDFVLWHQRGKLNAFGARLVPGPVAALFGDQDGLYASACNQYRDSMNEVAHWAKERNLMDYTGADCVPKQVSLLQAYMNQESAQLALLQRRDGYQSSIVSIEPLPSELIDEQARIEEALQAIPLFATLHDDERKTLAAKVRTIELGPMERIIIQGRPGSSLFLVLDGGLEVLSRLPNGQDQSVAFLDRLAVFGEISFLTGAERSSTVRAVRHAVVLEVHKTHLQPILQGRPQLLEELASLMEERLAQNDNAQNKQNAPQQQASLRERIRNFFWGA